MENVSLEDENNSEKVVRCGACEYRLVWARFARLPAPMHRAKCLLGRTSTGRERPHELFGRLTAEKVGSLPPVLVFFPP